MGMTVAMETISMDKVSSEKSENCAQPGIKHRIMVMSGKGGVGKSTIAVNLAYGLAMMGKSVGLLDADLHGPSVAKMTGTEVARASGNNEGKILPIRLHDNFYALSIAYLIDNPDSALIWRGPLKMSALKDMIQNTEWGDLDYLIVDCPPGTGDEPLSVVQLLERVDGAVVVSSAQDVALLDVRKNLDFARKLGVPILGLVENMSWISCPHCGEKVELFSGDGITRALMDYGTDLLAKLPFDTNITASCDAGRPFIYDFGRTPSAQILQEFVRGIVEKSESAVQG
jgi:ATP-binding protein involved in chromosome partitioning